MKKHIIQKMIPLCLTVLLIAALLAFGSVSAFAEDAHAHDEVTYDVEWSGELGTQSLFSSNYSIVLTADTTITGNMSLYNATCDLCLNGYTLTLTGFVGIEGTSTLNVYDCSEGQTGVITSDYAQTAFVLENNTLNLYGGTIKNTTTGSAQTAINSDGIVNIYGGTVSAVGDYAIYNKNSAALNIFGGRVENTADGGAYAILSNNANLMISGGTVAGNNASAVLMVYGTATISGGTVENLNSTNTSAVTVACASGATVTVSGGTITGSAKHAIEIYSGGTVYITGGDIVGGGENCIYNLGTLQISGGTLSGTARRGIYNNKGTVTISDGTIACTTELYSIYNAYGTLQISGGNIQSSGIYAFYQNGGTAHISGGTISCQSSGSTILIAQGDLYLFGSPSIKKITAYLNNGVKLYAHAPEDESTQYEGQPIGIAFENDDYVIGNTVIYGCTDPSLFPLAAKADLYIFVSDGTNLVLKSDHAHIWATAWSTDGTYHWHECTNTATVCEITENSEKDGYGEHIGGTATCLSGKLCDICLLSYGATDADNHESDEYEYVSNKNGTHIQRYACCGEIVNALLSCTYEEGSEYCTVCGGVDLGEYLNAATEELVAATEQIIARVEARTDLDDEFKAFLIGEYENFLNQYVGYLVYADTPAELTVIKEQNLCMMSVYEAMTDLMIKAELNGAVLTTADVDCISYLYQLLQYYGGYFAEMTDPESMDLMCKALNAMADYGEDCVDMFVTINTMPNIAADGIADAVKGVLYNGIGYEYILYYNSYMFLTAEDTDAITSFAFGMNDLWIKAAEKLDADLHDDAIVNVILMANAEACTTIYQTIMGEYMDSTGVIVMTAQQAEELLVYGNNIIDYPEVSFDYASITLGEDLKVNYYVSGIDGMNAQMRFTVNGYTKTVSGILTEGQYKFVFDGVAPQWIGDQIKAELLIDGEVVRTHLYSVIVYLDQLSSYTAEDLGYSEEQYSAMRALINELIIYAGAAQLYTGHNTDALVSEGVIPTFEPLTETDKAVTQGNIVTFAGATVYFDSTNRLRFYIQATDLSDVVFMLKVGNGEEIEVSCTAVGEYYLIETDAISATGFDDVYTLTAYQNGVADASFTYSVKSYVYSKQNGTDNIATLAQATYNYGLAAKAYKAAQ